MRRLLHRRRIEAEGLAPLELNVCAADVAYWLEWWCYTCDPRDLQVWPFDPFPRQAAFLAWLAERERLQEGGLVEKSRDMGATWLCCAYALHGWLFRPAFSAGFGSRKLELVDKLGDLDSIIEKVRFLLYRLPAWMLPAGFSRQEHDNFARLVNPATGGAVTGEGGDNIGRGGRKTVYFVDEAAYLPHPQLIERSLSETTRVRIDVSTPNGPGNPFAKKRFSGTVPVFTLHWRDDPRKGTQWYATKAATMDPVTVACELDIDYSASVEGITIPAAWVRAAVGLDLPTGQAKPLAGLDVAELGRNRTVLIARRGPVVQWPTDWGQTNTTETAHRARDHARRLGVSHLCYDATGVGAGVRGAWQAFINAQELGFGVRAVNAGEAPSEARWPDGQTSREKFLNVRAEGWWLLRARFEKSYEYVTQGRPHPPEDMISIPNHPQLIAELSQPLHEHAHTGKIKIESKDDMRKRGVSSPDFADALVLCFLARDTPAVWKQDRRALGEVAKAPAGVFWHDDIERDERDPGDPPSASEVYGGGHRLF